MSNKPLQTIFCFSDVHNNFAMLEPTNNTGDYVIRKTAVRAVDLLLKEKGQVDIVHMGGDYMSDYPHWNKSGKLPYEYYLGYKKKTVETFAPLAKGGKVFYVAGNHDYAQGESEGLGGPGKNGTYNSFDFYFTGPMNETFGTLPESEIFWKIGEHSGDKYAICYHYEVDGIHHIGMSSDPDLMWYTNGVDCSEDQLEWLDKKLREIDPDGKTVIFFSFHCPIDNRYEKPEEGIYYHHSNYFYEKLTPIFKGHKNLFHLFGHWETWMLGNTAKNLFHYDAEGELIKIKGDEKDSTEVYESFENRGFNAVYMGHFRPMYNSYKTMFDDDAVFGYGGFEAEAAQPSTKTPKMSQGMYIEVFEDRIVFTMMNFGTAEGHTPDDKIAPYTVYLYK